MREFSIEEREILKKLIKNVETPNCTTILENLIDFGSPSNFYIELRSKNDCLVIIKKSYIDTIYSEYGKISLKEVMKSFENHLRIILKLFEYLERKKMIVLTDDLPVITLGIIFDKSEPGIGHEIKDKETIRLLYHFTRRKIIPNKFLIEYVKNKFNDGNYIYKKNEIQKYWNEHKLESIIAIGTIGILIIAILAWLFPKQEIQNKSIKSKDPTEFNTTEFIIDNSDPKNFSDSNKKTISKPKNKGVLKKIKNNDEKKINTGVIKTINRK